jgi:hypothetical protein
MERARNVGCDADDCPDCEQGCEIAHGAGQGAEDTQFRAGVAIIGIECIADEAAVAGFAAEKRDLSLELLGGSGNEGSAEP